MCGNTPGCPEARGSEPCAKAPLCRTGLLSFPSQQVPPGPSHSESVVPGPCLGSSLQAAEPGVLASEQDAVGVVALWGPWDILTCSNNVDGCFPLMLSHQDPYSGLSCRRGASHPPHRRCHRASDRRLNSRDTALPP